MWVLVGGMDKSAIWDCRITGNLLAFECWKSWEVVWGLGLK